MFRTVLETRGEFCSMFITIVNINHKTLTNKSSLQIKLQTVKLLEDNFRVTNTDPRNQSIAVRFLRGMFDNPKVFKN